MPVRARSPRSTWWLAHEASRWSKLTRLLAIPLVVVIYGVAWAHWTAGSGPGGNGAAAATTVNRGATPTASATGSAVTLTWAARTLASGPVVSGYVVKRYDAATLAQASIKSSCTGTVTSTSCTENSVPTGQWVYSVTPVFATNWRGAESVKSNPVTIAAGGYADAVGATAGLLSHWRFDESAANLVSSDSFTGASGTALPSRTGEIGASWAFQAGANTEQLEANRAFRGGTGYSLNHTTATPPSADYSVEADLVVRSNLAGDAAGVVGRWTPAPTPSTWRGGSRQTRVGTWSSTPMASAPMSSTSQVSRRSPSARPTGSGWT